ncbi:MAG: type II toxin-antitoxin system RelE/ParE family toxin [bacterium]|nr:type II toxin-antitoxin system RelE/ParE family toxin [bacterium]
MNVEFLTAADVEFDNSIIYYNFQREGLGFEFAEEVEKTIDKILQNPKAWTLLSKRARRCLTDRFPYGIIYQIRPEKILIIAVMHLHREPDLWQSRIL